MTYGYKTLEDGSIVPYPIDTQLPIQKPMTFQEFIKAVDNKFYSSSYKSQLRYGQYVMNELYNVWPEKYAQIVGSDIDCFYNNDIMRLTLDNLEKSWNHK
jgi:hypothetical protein